MWNCARSLYRCRVLFLFPFDLRASVRSIVCDCNSLLFYFTTLNYKFNKGGVKDEPDHFGQNEAKYHPAFFADVLSPIVPIANSAQTAMKKNISRT